MEYPISPWAGESFGSLDVPSPNQRLVASFPSLTEVAMGAPQRSDLHLNGIKVEGSFSCSCIWSPDSNYLALPKWIVGGAYNRQQQFSIYAVPEQKLYVLEERYSVLQLESFKDGIVRGVDSPAFKPSPFEFRLSELCELKQ